MEPQGGNIMFKNSSSVAQNISSGLSKKEEFMLYLLFKKTKVCNPHEQVFAKMIKIKSLLLKGLMSNLGLLLSKPHSPSDFLRGLFLNTWQFVLIKAFGLLGAGPTCISSRRRARKPSLCACPYECKGPRLGAGCWGGSW